MLICLACALRRGARPPGRRRRGRSRAAPGVNKELKASKGSGWRRLRAGRARGPLEPHRPWAQRALEAERARGPAQAGRTAAGGTRGPGAPAPRPRSGGGERLFSALAPWGSRGARGEPFRTFLTNQNIC